MYLFGQERVRTFDEMVFAGLPPVNDFVGWAFLIMTAVSCAVLLEAGLRRASDAPYAFDASAVVRVVLVFVMTLTFYPASQGVHARPDPALDQRPLCAGAAAVGARCRMRKRRADGADLPDEAALRAVALWAALNREWRFGAALVAVGAAGLALSVWRYG